MGVNSMGSIRQGCRKRGGAGGAIAPHKIWPRGQKGPTFFVIFWKILIFEEKRMFRFFQKIFQVKIVTEYEDHVFRVATHLTHYWTITWLSSRRQTVISTVLDSDCFRTTVIVTRDIDDRSCTLIRSRTASQHALPINSQTNVPSGSICSLP